MFIFRPFVRITLFSCTNVNNLCTGECSFYYLVWLSFFLFYSSGFFSGSFIAYLKPLIALAIDARSSGSFNRTKDNQNYDQNDYEVHRLHKSFKHINTSKSYYSIKLSWLSNIRQLQCFVENKHRRNKVYHRGRVVFMTDSNLAFLQRTPFCVIQEGCLNLNNHYLHADHLRSIVFDPYNFLLIVDFVEYAQIGNDAYAWVPPFNFLYCHPVGILGNYINGRPLLFASERYGPSGIIWVRSDE